MKVYGYMKCGTCRKALKWLDAAGIDHDFVDITLTPPNASLLKRALATGRYELKHLFNTSGGQYRAMDIKHRLPEMTKIEAIDKPIGLGEIGPFEKYSIEIVRGNKAIDHFWQT